MVGMYGGRYWFHCEICKQEFHLTQHGTLPPGVLHSKRKLKNGLVYKCVVHDTCILR